MTRQRSKSQGRIVFGFLVVAVGVSLTLDNLGLFDFDDLWQYWPIALMLVGVSKLGSGEPGRGLLWLAVGTAFLLPVVFEAIDPGDVWDFWPLFLVAIGLRMVVRSFFPRARRRHGSGRGPEAAPGAEDLPGAELKASAFMTSVHRRVSGVVRRGDLTAVMGGCDIDLTAAEPVPEGAVIEMFAFWGGVTLRIPEHWTVDPRVVVVMGVIEDDTRQRAATGPKLVVKGMALMGGLEIRN